MSLTAVVRDLDKRELDTVPILDFKGTHVFSDAQNIFADCRFNAELNTQGDIELIVKNFPYVAGRFAQYGELSLTFAEQDGGVELLVKDGMRRQEIPLSVQPNSLREFFVDGQNYQLLYSQRDSWIGALVPSIINLSQDRLMFFIDSGSKTGFNLARTAQEEKLAVAPPSEPLRNEAGGIPVEYTYATLPFNKERYTIREASELLLKLDPVYTVEFIRNQIYVCKKLFAVKEGKHTYIYRDELKRYARRPISSRGKSAYNYTREEIMDRLEIDDKQFLTYIEKGALKFVEGGLITGLSAAKLYDKRFPQITSVHIDDVVGAAPPAGPDITSGDRGTSSPPEMPDDSSPGKNFPKSAYVNLSHSGIKGQAGKDYFLLLGQTAQHKDAAYLRAYHNSKMILREDLERYNLARSYITEEYTNTILNAFEKGLKVEVFIGAGFELKANEILTFQGKGVYSPEMIRRAASELFNDQILTLNEVTHFITREKGWEFNMSRLHSVVKSEQVLEIAFWGDIHHYYIRSQVEKLFNPLHF